MTYRDQFKEIEDRIDQSEVAIIQSIFKDITASLQEYEGYFLEETIKKLHLNGADSSKNINKTIQDVVIHDPKQYLHVVDTYVRYQSATGTMNDAIDLYVESLKEKLVEGLSDDEINSVISSYIGFVQRKSELSDTGALKEENTDINNFMEIIKRKIQEADKSKKIQKFLEKVVGCIEEERIFTKGELVQALNNSKNNLSNQEENDLKRIKERLERVVGNSYQEFVLEFLNKVEKEKIYAPTEIENLVGELLKDYYIGDNLKEDKGELADYLQRLRSIMMKKE